MSAGRRRRRGGALAVVVALLIAATVTAANAAQATRPAPATAAATSTPTPLLQDPPDTQQPFLTELVTAMVVDRARGHLFTSSGLAPSLVATVTVTDMDGHVIAS